MDSNSNEVLGNINPSQDIHTPSSKRKVEQYLLTTNDILKYNNTVLIQLNGMVSLEVQIIENRKKQQALDMINDLKTFSDSIQKIRGQSNQVMKDFANIQGFYLSLEQEMRQLKIKTQKCLGELSDLKRQDDEWVMKIQAIQREIEEAKKQSKEYDIEIEKQEQCLQQQALQKQYLEYCYTELNHQKKVMANQLQSVIGNIRVYLRIKPFQQNQKQEPFFNINRRFVKFTLPKNYKSQNHRKQYSFVFEDIFENCSQEQVFNEFQPLVQIALQGKNICIFAYGQTGSGKTHTMQGTFENQGIIPRSLSKIFAQNSRSDQTGCKIEVFLECAEIYNEEVRYLLPKQKRINSKQEIEQLMDLCNSARSVAETNCNQRSSRSHLIFTIKLIVDNGTTRKESSLNLIDLAGSQRIQSSKVEGDRLKQTISINKSLTNLGLVIEGMAHKNAHIPFRNSKLTAILEPFLSGDSLTVMMVCISPLVSSWNQTMPALSFAQKVKKVTTLSHTDQSRKEDIEDFQ